jgi:hypothetical protein
MKIRNSRKFLQVALAVSALAPLLTGLLGMAGIDNPLYQPPEKPVGILLDSNLRFLNGISVGIGLCTFMIIPGIKKKTFPLRMICIVIFIGSIGRIVSFSSYGFPPFPFSIFIFWEIIAPPLFVVWQSRLAR